MTDGFNQPSSGGGFFKPKEALGHLVLFTKVHDIYYNPTNVYKGKSQPRDEAKVDMVDLDGDQAHRERVIVTHPGIVNRLTAGASNVLGRIGRVAMEGDGDDTFFWVLNPYEDSDVPKAQAWVQAWQSGQFGQPQNAPQSAPNQGAQQQAQAPAPQAPQSAPQSQPGAVPGLPPGVDVAQLAALMQSLQGQAPQTPGQGNNPPY